MRKGGLHHQNPKDGQWRQTLTALIEHHRQAQGAIR
jgi:hypothetical protein